MLSPKIQPGHREVSTGLQGRGMGVGNGRTRRKMLASSFPKERTGVSAGDIGVHGILDTDGVAMLLSPWVES